MVLFTRCKIARRQRQMCIRDRDISFCGRCVLCVDFIMDLLSVFMGMRYFALVFE